MTFQEAAEKYSGQGIDFKDVLKRMGGNESLCVKFLHKFLEDQTYGEFCTAYGKDDMRQAMVHAHTLKGLGGNLGLRGVYEQSACIVDKLRSGETDIAREAQALKEAYEAAVDTIKQIG